MLFAPVMCYRIPGNYSDRFANLIIGCLNWRLTSAYRQSTGGIINYINPESFSEKIQTRKIFDRNSIFTVHCDKLAAAEFAIARCPELRAPKLLWKGTDANLIPFDQLKPPYIIKPTHMSGKTYIVRTHEDLNIKAARRSCAKWLRRSYGRSHGEWAYSHVPRQIIVEELLPGPTANSPPIDYRFYVFNGKIQFIKTTVERGGVWHHTCFDPDWGRLPYTFWRGKKKGDSRFAPTIESMEPPPSLNKMLKIAEQLGKNIDFVRVDLYNVDGVIYFGELTHYDASGHSIYFLENSKRATYPERNIDIMMGHWWQQPQLSPWTKVKLALKACLA
ncbi:MAG: ATP-grasp fold amidoligase family protein [Hyphomicrobiaceae bacterium]